MKQIRSTERLLALGLALYADRRTMERRVRGIFGRKRTAWFARALSAALCLAVLAGCFTTACVPVRAAAYATHENELNLMPVRLEHVSAVALPGASATPATPFRSPLLDTLGAPERWQWEQTSADGELRVLADLALTLPNVSAVPIASAEVREVTEADLQRVTDAFFGNGVTFTYATQDTKEYAEAYLEKEKALYDSVIDGTCENKVPSFHKSVVKQYEAYRTLAQTAPSAAERRTLPPVFTEHTDVFGDTFMGFRGVAEKDGTEYLVSSAANTGRNAAVNVMEAYQDYALTYMGSYRDAPVDVAISKDEAVALASALASQIDGGLALAHVFTVGTHAAAQGSEAEQTMWAWQCVFMRAVNGVGTVYDSRDVGSDISSEVYGRVNEALEITVDDRGVCNIHWINPMTVTAAENATLLPFAAITEKLADQLREKMDYDVADGEVQTIYVRHAELGLMRVGKPGAKAYTLEPVWSFFTSFEAQPSYMTPDRLRPSYQGDPAFWNSLTVSAVDGRVLDRDRGH